MDTANRNDQPHPNPRRSLWIVLCLVAAALLFIPIIAYTSAEHSTSNVEDAPRLSVTNPALESLLQVVNPDQLIDIIIYMKTTANLEALDLPARKHERRRLVVNTLKEVAASSQAPILDQLDLLVTDGAVVSYRIQ
jgi:hypothetical protein